MYLGFDTPRLFIPVSMPTRFPVTRHMAHWALIPLVQIADHISKACLEILRASVIPVTSIDTRTNSVFTWVRALLPVFSARDVDRLLAKRIVK